MAHAVELRKECPDTETWCGYLDGSIQGEQKDQLAAHLERCERCFEEVASIQAGMIKSEEEEKLLETPGLLLEKGKILVPEPLLKPVWKVLSYGVAACLLIGIALNILECKDYSCKFRQSRYQFRHIEMIIYFW